MKWLARQFRTFVAMFRWWRRCFTTPGQALTIALALCIPSLFAQSSALVLLAAAIAALLLVAMVSVQLLRPRLAARLSGAPLVLHGESAVLRFELESSSKLPSGPCAVRLADSAARWQPLGISTHAAALGPAAGEVRITLAAHERGVFPAPPLAIVSSFPLHLVRRTQLVSPAGEIAVAPSYRPLSALDRAALGLAALEAAYAASLPVGDGGDYFGSREHVPGTPVRRWDYAASARLQRPIAREYRDPPAGRAAIVVDPFAPQLGASPLARAEFEALLSHAAAVGEALFDAGMPVALLLPAAHGEALRLAPLASHSDLLRALAAAPAAAELAGESMDDLPQGEWATQTSLIISHAACDGDSRLAAAIEACGGRVVRVRAGVSHDATIAAGAEALSC